jgi:hypothetical protein
MDKVGREAFIKSAAIAAKKSETQTGVPASVIVAQAILESGWGEHHMGNANNYFGIKAQERNGKIVLVLSPSAMLIGSRRNTIRTRGRIPSSPISAPIRTWETHLSIMESS